MKNKINFKILGVLLSFVLIVSFLFSPLYYHKDTIASANTNEAKIDNEITEKQYNDIVQTDNYENINPVTQESETLFSDIENECSETIESIFDEKPYVVSEIAEVIFKIESSYEIKNINYDCNGFEIIKIDTKDNDFVEVNLRFAETIERMHFKIIVELANENILVANIYGYYFDGFFYLSRSSEEDKETLYYDCALSNNELTIEQYENLTQDISCLPTENKNALKSNNITDSKNDKLQAISKANASSNSTVCGKWEWFDGTYYHPLKFNLVSVIIPKQGQSCASDTTIDTYTDANGYFSVSINFSSAVDVKVQVRSAGETVLVRKKTLYGAYTSTTPSKTVNPGSTVSFNYYLSNTTTGLKAFQVCQALIMGSKYVEAMTGSKAPQVTCHYPKDNDQYSSFWDVVDITEEAYEYWDIILHEYGHKLQHHYKIQDNPGGSHIITDDQIAVHNKSKGIRLAWGEGWPTFFAIVVTQFYGSQLSNIKYINDTKYDSYSYDSNGNLYTWNQSVERSYVVGEGCEAAVFAVLYDFYDSYSSSETWDTLSLSHNTMFNAVIKSGAKTFSDFLNYFTSNYYSANDGKIGAILSNYGMSSKDFRITSGTLSYTSPPSFSWTAGGPASCRHNSFEVEFYNSSNSVILRTARQSATNLTLTAEQWAQILSANGTEIKAAVVSYQTDNPSTGAYYSMQLVAAKPAKVNPEINLSMASSSRYLEQKITLAAGQYYDYLFTSAVSSTKIFQTFGSIDTKLELYSNAGTLLASNDDGGYSTNALIRYSTTANTTYRLRVKFYSSTRYGTTKLAVTSSYGATNSNSSNITNYEDIYSITGYTSFNFGTYAQKNYSRLITFTPPSSANYTFTIASDFDTYIYVIDPRSNELIVSGQDYNDDSGEGMNPLLTKKLEAGIPYLVIYSAFNPSSLSETKDLTVKIYKA